MKRRRLWYEHLLLPELPTLPRETTQLKSPVCSPQTLQSSPRSTSDLPPCCFVGKKCESISESPTPPSPMVKMEPSPLVPPIKPKNTQAIQPKLKWKLRLRCRCMERPGLGTRLNGQGLNFRLRVVWKVASSTYTSTNWMSKWCKSYAKIQVCDIHVENLQLDFKGKPERNG